MFSGIVEAVGTIEDVVATDGGNSLQIRAPELLRPGDGINLGDSVSVSGVCLTATNISPESFTVDVTPETLRRTTLGEKNAGDGVNLELALKFGDRVGGHPVQGHVDGVGTVVELRQDGDAKLVAVEASADIIAYTIEKGFVAVDGVSLTCFNCDDSCFSFSLIPFTAENTTLGAIEVGSRVNIEPDMAAKYLEQFTYRFLESRDS